MKIEKGVQPRFYPKTCKGCGKEFTPTVGFQKFCEECRTGRATKKRSRARKAAKEEKEAQRLKNLTRVEFWETNRKKLPQEEQERLEQRTQDILFLCNVMDDYLAGTNQTSQQDLEDTIAEVAAEVAQHGLCDLNVALIEWWRPHEKAFLDAVVAKGGPTETFVKVGYIDAIPSDVYHRFASKFMQKPTTNPTLKPEWVVLTCSTPGCGQGLHAMPRELANEFAGKGVKPLCYRCVDLERKSVAQATIFTEPAAKIHDGYGAHSGFDRDMEHG